MEDEEELRTKLAADIEKYQRDASISSAPVAPAATSANNDVKAKTIDVTVDEIVSPIASGMIGRVPVKIRLYDASMKGDIQTDHCID